MSKSIYFISEFASLMDGKKWTKAIGAVLCVFAFIVMIYAILLPQGQPVTTGSNLEKFPDDHKTIAQIQSGLSSSEIDDLYLSLRQLQSVENLILVLSEEVQQGLLTIPSELSQDADFFLVKTGDREALLDDLKNEPRIRMVASLSNQPRSNSTNSLALWGKVVILFIGVLLAGVAFYLLRSVAKDLLASWEGELQIVKYSGLSKFSVKFPLIVLGTLTGLSGSGLSLLLLIALSTWSNTGLWLADKLPGLFNNISPLIITIWSLLLGLVLGFLASLSSLQVVDEMWN